MPGVKIIGKDLKDENACAKENVICVGTFHIIQKGEDF